MRICEVTALIMNGPQLVGIQIVDKDSLATYNLNLLEALDCIYKYNCENFSVLGGYRNEYLAQGNWPNLEEEGRRKWPIVPSVYTSDDIDIITKAFNKFETSRVSYYKNVEDLPVIDFNTGLLIKNKRGWVKNNLKTAIMAIGSVPFEMMGQVLRKRRGY